MTIPCHPAFKYPTLSLHTPPPPPATPPYFSPVHQSKNSCSELKIGHSEMIHAEREERKRQMEKVHQNRRNPLYKPVAEQFHDLQPKQVRDSMSPDRLQKLRNTIKPDATQWDAQGRKAGEVSAGIRSLDATVNFSSNVNEAYVHEEAWLSKTLDSKQLDSRTPSPGLRAKSPSNRAKSPRSKSPRNSANSTT